MKNSKLLLLLFISTILASCTQEALVENDLNTANRIDVMGPQICQVVDLIAGQNYDAGDFSVSENINGEIVLRYETMDGWQLDAIHLYAGDCTLIPLNGSGNPRIGHFPNQSVLTNGTTSYEYTIPANESIMPGDCIAAHAEVSKDGQNETAWAEGLLFSEIGNSWAMYLPYTGCSN
jgi:hypothetical protein